MRASMSAIQEHGFPCSEREGARDNYIRLYSRYTCRPQPYRFRSPQTRLSRRAVFGDTPRHTGLITHNTHTFDHLMCSFTDISRKYL